MLKRTLTFSILAICIGFSSYAQSNRDRKPDRSEDNKYDDDDDNYTREDRYREYRYRRMPPRPPRPQMVRRERAHQDKTYYVRKERPVYNYAPNILRFFPITVFDNYIGLGLSYERILDKEGKFGFNMPLSFGMDMNNYPNNNTRYAFSINPGVKFYPTGQHKVTYALGLSLFYTYGERYDYNNSYPYPSYYEEGSIQRGGMMVNNYVQFNLTPKFNIGLELGIGPSYINSYKAKSSYYSYSEGIQAYGQASFHVGYRF